MPMPKAPMNKYGSPVFRKDKIGGSGKVPPVQPESESQPMQERTNSHLRPTVPAPDLRHVPAAFLWREAIHGRALQERLMQGKISHLRALSATPPPSPSPSSRSPRSALPATRGGGRGRLRRRVCRPGGGSR